jgi:hypothetical protein
MNALPTREQAMRDFAAMVARHGLQWTAAQNVPRETWDRLAVLNQVMSTEDRREAIGLQRR